MTGFSRVKVTLALVLCGAVGAWARGQMVRPPQMPGQFRPVVGSGALYEVTVQGNPKIDWAFAVVGKESVAVTEGYWLEMRVESGPDKGMVLKQLLVLGAGKPEIKRVIMQAPGEPPMAIPASMLSRTAKAGPGAGTRAEDELGVKVGTETVAVPAGTFTCEHYRSQSEGETTDVWIFPKVSPYGVVKMVSGNTTMVLSKLLENESSRITGEPEEMETEAPESEEEE